MHAGRAATVAAVTVAVRTRRRKSPPLKITSDPKQRRHLRPERRNPPSALTFDEAVDVDTSGGTPRHQAIDMDPAEWGEKQASLPGRQRHDDADLHPHGGRAQQISTQGIAVLENYPGN